MYVQGIRNCSCIIMEEYHGTKLNGMHTTSVVISHRFAEFNGQYVIPSILSIVYVCRRFDLLPLIPDMVHLTQYTFSESCVPVSSIGVPILNACLALATVM
jgi:hypothetical protein